MINYSKLAILFLVIIILIIASLFSFLETSVISITEYKLKMLKEKYMWAKYAYKLKHELNKVLIFSLFGNSLFNAAFTTITTVLVADLLIDYTRGIILPLTTILIAFIIIVFSEALPKIIAAKSPVVVLSVIAIPLYYIFIFSKPIIWALDKIVYTITKLFTFNNNEATTLEELKIIIADEKMPFKAKHRSILLNSLKIKDITIKEVLIPLRMVESINISGDIELICKQIYTTHHTQIIVYDGKIDNIIGYIHIKDILAIDKEAMNKENLVKIIRPIHFVSDFFPIVQQIHRAQKFKSRIFGVINEYGDVLGVACLEDMLEMIFGDYTTESPQQRNLAIKNSQNELIVDGTMLIRELNEMYNLDIDLFTDALTINGLILKTLNGIPNIGVSFKLKNLVFEVISVGTYWVERVKISILIDLEKGN